MKSTCLLSRTLEKNINNVYPKQVQKLCQNSCNFLLTSNFRYSSNLCHKYKLKPYEVGDRIAPQSIVITHTHTHYSKCTQGTYLDMELELELELELDFGVLQTVITKITVNPDNLQNKEHSQLLYDSK